MVSTDYLENLLLQSLHVSNVDCSWLADDPYWSNGQLIKVTMILNVKMISAHFLKNYYLFSFNFSQVDCSRWSLLLLGSVGQSSSSQWPWMSNLIPPILLNLLIIIGSLSQNQGSGKGAFVSLGRMHLFRNPWFSGSIIVWGNIYLFPVKIKSYIYNDCIFVCLVRITAGKNTKYWSVYSTALICAILSNNGIIKMPMEFWQVCVIIIHFLELITAFTIKITFGFASIFMLSMQYNYNKINYIQTEIYVTILSSKKNHEK